MKRYGFLLGCVVALASCATPPNRPQSDPPAATGSITTATGNAASPTPTSSITTIHSLSEVTTQVAQISAKNILVVFDIDDTLLTAKTPPFFGSDLWYVWQKNGAPGGTKAPCLTEFLALNYLVGTQQATEKVVGPNVVSAIGHDKMILTSRSPAYRAPTERELAVAKYPVLANIGGPAGGVGFSWVTAESPFDRNFVTYANGIFMTEGGHKGRMLWHLLVELKMERKYQAIVLVDDTWRKQLDMQETLAAEGVAFYGLHYALVKDDSDQTKPLDPSAEQKKDAQAFWDAMKIYMKAQYPDFENRCMKP